LRRRPLAAAANPNSCADRSRPPQAPGLWSAQADQRRRAGQHPARRAQRV